MSRNEVRPYEQVDSILRKAMPQFLEESRGACAAELVREYEKLLPERDRLVNKSLSQCLEIKYPKCHYGVMIEPWQSILP